MVAETRYRLDSVGFWVAGFYWGFFEDGLNYLFCLVCLHKVFVTIFSDFVVGFVFGVSYLNYIGML